MDRWRWRTLPLFVAWLPMLIVGCGQSGPLELRYIDENGKAVSKYAPPWWDDVYAGLARHADNADLELLRTASSSDSIPADLFFLLDLDNSDWNGEIVLVRGSSALYYFRKDGSLVTRVDCPFSEGFSEGLAAVCVGEETLKEDVPHVRWGYIDATGTFVIEPRFTQATPFSEGLAFVVEGGEDKPIRRVAEGELTPLVRDPEIKAGYIDKSGAYVIPPELFTGHPCSEGLCVCEDREFQTVVFTTDGTRVNRFEGLTLIGPFQEGLAPAWNLSRDAKKGVYVDTEGNIALRLEKEYDFMESFHEGRALVQQGEFCGYIDRTGEEVIPVKYRAASRFHDGVAAVAK